MRHLAGKVTLGIFLICGAYDQMVWADETQAKEELVPENLQPQESSIDGGKPEKLDLVNQQDDNEEKSEEAAIPKESSEQQVEEKEVEEAQLSEEEKAMREIEPNFVLKDDSIVDLFLLAKMVKSLQEEVNTAKEATGKLEGEFFQKFQSEFDDYVSSEVVDEANDEYSQSLKDVVSSYEAALKFDPNNPYFTEDALYNYGLAAFEEDEKEYFEKLAKYNEAVDQGDDTVDYPIEDFSRTIEAYEKLMDKNPKYQYMDGVYYLYGLALLYEGAFDESLEAFEKLVKTYRKSRFSEEVWFRMGEYFFDYGDEKLDDALLAYKRVLRNKKSPFYDKALYKLAWTYFQQDKYDLAARNFYNLLRLIHGKKYQGTLSGIKEEAVVYLVKSFAEKLEVAEAKNKQKRTPEEEKEYQGAQGLKLAKIVAEYVRRSKKSSWARDVMIEVASRLLDEGKTEGAVYAFETAIRFQPRNEDNPRIASQIVDVLNQAGEKERAYKKNLELIRRYNPKSRWYRRQKKNPGAQLFARNAVRDAILALAVQSHKEAKKLLENKEEEELAKKKFKEASNLYLRYIKEFPERDDTYKAIFYFAETSYELKNERLALEAYKMVKNYPLPMPEPFRRDATYNIVFTYRSVLDNAAQDGDIKKVNFDSLKAEDAGSEVEELPPMVSDYLAAIDEFLQVAPQDPQVPVLLFHAAAIHYTYGMLDEAKAQFENIINNYSSSQAASVAARLLVDEAVKKEDWVKVAHLAAKFREQNLGGSGEEFAKIETKARFKIAKTIFDDANKKLQDGQLAEAKAAFKESSELFKDLLASVPDSPYSDIMLFNVAKATVQSGSAVLALPFYVQLYKKYPDSEYAKPARFEEALLLEKMLKFSAAAKAYDGIIKEDPKSPAAADAVLNKALLYEAAGEPRNAAETYITFANKYPQRPEAGVSLLTAATLYKKLGQKNKQISMLNEFIKKFQNDKEKASEIIEAKVMIADTYNELYQDVKNPAQKNQYQKLRDSNYRDAVKLFDKESSSAYAAFYAAKAQLFLEKPEQEAFKNMRINARTGKAQGEQLKRMMEKMTSLVKKNEEIIATYRQPVSNVASLYRISQKYAHLSKSLVEAPCPIDVKKIDEYACDEYALLLEEKASVLDEKALSALEQGYQIAADTYDVPKDLLDEIVTSLAILKPQEYQKVGNYLTAQNTYEYVYGGRMLSDGRMSSYIHPKEKDPDLYEKDFENESAEATDKESEGKEQDVDKDSESALDNENDDLDEDRDVEEDDEEDDEDEEDEDEE